MKAIIYTTKTCAYCGGVKKWLDSKGVEYTEKNAEDMDVLREVLKLSGVATVPQTVINGKVIVGPNYGALAEAIA